MLRDIKVGDLVSSATYDGTHTVVSTGLVPNTLLLILEEGSGKFGYRAGHDLEDITMLESTRSIIQSKYPDWADRKFSYDSLSNIFLYPKQTSVKKENKSMSKIVDMVKSDAAEAAYRVASTQITSAVKGGLMKAFQAKGGDSGQMEMLKMLLDTPVGDAIVALVLGYGLTYAPGLKDDPRVVRLSSELRTKGMTDAGNMVVGMAMESFLPIITGALSALPEAETSAVRVSREEEEEDEDVSPPAKKSASR